ncbi:unnamed protein product, partial [Ectocarpus sp. 4 AP-2014]
SGQISLRVAAKTSGLSLASLHDRVKKKVAIDARVGPGTVLSKEEEDFGRCLHLRLPTLLVVGSRELKDAVRNTCGEERKVP